MGTDELRKYRRIPFSSSEKIDALCKKTDGKMSVVRFHVANISEGGLGLMVSKSEIKSVQKNEVFLLEAIDGDNNLSFLTNIELEVKWVLDSEYMENIGIGCSFIGLTMPLREKILEFMNTMDQY